MKAATIAMCLVAHSVGAVELHLEPVKSSYRVGEAVVIRAIVSVPLLSTALDSEDLGFQFNQAGRFGIDGTISTDARAWYDEWRKKGHRPDQAPFSRQELFAGPVSANTEILVVE